MPEPEPIVIVGNPTDGYLYVRENWFQPVLVNNDPDGLHVRTAWDDAIDDTRAATLPERRSIVREPF